MEKTQNKFQTVNLTRISKSMSYILRHAALEHGLQIQSNGFINLDELLNSNPMKKLKATKDQIIHIVEIDNKGRFELNKNEIRAVQGHSIKSVIDEEILEPIKNIFEYPIIVHGTYFEAWERIKLTGLNRMKRNSIHFSIGYKHDEHVISGMRSDCEVFIELNAARAFYNGIDFFVSKNKVVLSPGINGIIPHSFFKKVTNNKGELLFQQDVTIGVYIQIFNCTDVDCISNLKLEGEYVIFNVKNKVLISSGNIRNFDDLNNISNICINEKLILETFSLLIEEKFEDKYKKIVKLCEKHFMYLGFFNCYITVNTSIETGNDSINNNYIDQINKWSSKIVNSSNFKLIDFDNKKISNTSNVTNICNVITQSSKTDLLPKKIVYETKLNKSLLVDKDFLKIYVLLFLNFSEDDMLTSIDYIIIHDREIQNFKSFKFFIENKKMKNNLEEFLEELKKNLIKEKVFEKYLILCINSHDLNYITQYLRKSSIKIPNLFQRNIIFLNEKDFNLLETSIMDQTVETFFLKYIFDENTIKNLKYK